MKFFILLICVLSKNSYKIIRHTSPIDVSKYEFLLEKAGYLFYKEVDKVTYEELSLPEQVRKLIHTKELRISANKRTYIINPFGYVKMIQDNEQTHLGNFSDLRFEKNAIVCIYKDGDKCDINGCLKTKIIYTLKDSETEIKKYFSGEPSSYVFKVSGRFLGEKCERFIIHVLIANMEKKKEEIIKETIDKSESLEL